MFGAANGVIRTRVGYTGGKKPSPTYYNIGDHTETIEIEYDPEKINYESLLKVFWSQHNPTSHVKRQYMSAIFYNDEEQKSIAENSLEEAQTKMTRQILTQILPAERFYNAEDYHQKYILRQNRQIFNSLNLSDAEVITSPLAAKLTGFLGGYGGSERLESEIDSWDLNEKQKEKVKEMVMRSGCSGMFCSMK